jgi:hypothetical protein
MEWEGILREERWKESSGRGGVATARIATCGCLACSSLVQIVDIGTTGCRAWVYGGRGPARISVAALSMITKEKHPMRAFLS